MLVTDHAASAGDAHTRHLAGVVISAVLLVFAPLFYGGNRPLPLMAMELLACGLMLVCAREWRVLMQLSPLARAWLGVLIVLPGVYLIPFPFSPAGTEIYAQVLQLAGVETAWRPLAVVPAQTERSWYALALPLAMFFAVMVLHQRYIPTLIFVAVFVTAGEALLGVLQYLGGPTSVLRFGIPHYPDSAIGTYPNRNHLAGLLEMALPVALALMVSAVSHADRFIHSPFEHLWSFSRQRNMRIAVGAAVVLLLLIGLVLTRSRTGMALAGVGVLISILVFARAGEGARAVVRPIAWVVGSGLMVLVLLGLIPILMRFVTLDPLHDVRWTVFARTIELAGIFFPLGSGPGTFSSVFPRVQPPDLRYFINHAHNDYLEWVVEAGLFALVLVVIFGVLFVQRWWYLWRRCIDQTEASSLVQMAAGLSLGLLAIHSLVDFNLRIPANQLYFAFWAGVFFRPGWGQGYTPIRAPDAGVVSRARLVEPLGVRTPPPGVKNPFSE